ncbi:MAG TPA: radical SAM protein, partial [Magnetococcales bacterium]|nr:radical SAM protein [Magnetococcales bacterium]
MKKTNSSQRVAILTMGCRVNQFETDLILKMGSDHGHDTTCSLDKAGIIIINTCSVTRESERQARKLIRKLGRDYPDARLVVTGCYAQRSPETFANQPNVDLVLGNGDKKNLWNFWNRHRQNHPSTDPFPISMEEGGSIAVHGPILDHSENRARASLQIQDGCDRKCTYCLIPQVRGPGVSMEARRILQQAASYLDSGSRELVLLGIDIGAYGRDLSPVLSLSAILNMLIPLCQNARLRLSSIDPMDLNDELLELFAPG